jgi:cold-inducible RNA-binding protein
MRAEPGSRLYIGNVPFDASEEDLRGLFDGHRVTDVSVPVDKDTGRKRGFAFVGFFSADDAEKALVAMAGAVLGGRVLVLNVARERGR